jgi:hypothetical protein
MSLLNVNKINKGEYHIHIDASYLSSQTEALLLDKFGFVDTAFC